MTSARKVTVLYFDGCPNVELTLERLRAAGEAAGVPLEVEMLKVADPETATRERFLGSPSVRIDGRDLEEPAGEGTYDLRCRVYTHAGRIEGAPSVDLIANTLLGAAAGHATPGLPHDCCSPKVSR